jgi:hypothetical protein
MSGCLSTYHYFTKDVMINKLDNYLIEKKEDFKNNEGLDNFVYIVCKGFKDYNDCKYNNIFFEKKGVFESSNISAVSYIQEYKKEKKLALKSKYEETFSIKGKEKKHKGLNISIVIDELYILEGDSDSYGNYIQYPKMDRKTYNLNLLKKNTATYLNINNKNIVYMWL